MGVRRSFSLLKILIYCGFLSLVYCDNSIFGELTSPSESATEPGLFGFVDQSNVSLSKAIQSNISGLKGLSEPSPVILDGRGGKPFQLDEARNPDPNSLAFNGTRPYSLLYNQDGTKLFALNRDSSNVLIYNLEQPYDIANGTYDTSVSFSAQDSVGTSIAFNTDGSKFFLLSRDTARVYQYNLSTPFDPQTAVYQSFYYVGGVVSSPFSLSFNPDGSRMFVLSSSTDCFHQYSLSTNFDVTSASYSTINSCFTGQDSSAQSIYFSPDGSRLFMLGSSTDSIYQYSLPTPFDLSVVNYDSITFSLANQMIWPYSILFSPNGDRLLAVGRETKAIFQYKLSVGFDLSSATFDTPDLGLNDFSLKLDDQDNSPVSFCFSNDGLKLFVLGLTNDAVFQYTLFSPFDITSALYGGVQFPILAQEASAAGVRFSADGTKMFILGRSAPVEVHQYNLATAFDLNTTTFDVTLDVSANVSIGFSDGPSFDFSPSGNRMFILSNGSYLQYNLGTPFDIATATIDASSYTDTSISLASSVIMNNDGNKVFIVVKEFGYMADFSLTTPYDVSTSIPGSVVHWLGTQDRFVADIRFNNDGTEFFFLGINDGIFRQYISDGGGPEYRVCFDPECEQVKHDWRQASDVLVEETDFIEVRTNSSASNTTQSVISVQIGNLSDEWKIVTN